MVWRMQVASRLECVAVCIRYTVLIVYRIRLELYSVYRMHASAEPRPAKLNMDARRCHHTSAITSH